MSLFKKNLKSKFRIQNLLEQYIIDIDQHGNYYNEFTFDRFLFLCCKKTNCEVELISNFEEFISKYYAYSGKEKSEIIANNFFWLVVRFVYMFGYIIRFDIAVCEDFISTILFKSTDNTKPFCEFNIISRKLHLKSLNCDFGYIEILMNKSKKILGLEYECFIKSATTENIPEQINFSRNIVNIIRNAFRLDSVLKKNNYYNEFQTYKLHQLVYIKEKKLLILDQIFFNYINQIALIFKNKKDQNFGHENNNSLFYSNMIITNSGIEVLNNNNNNNLELNESKNEFVEQSEYNNKTSKNKYKEESINDYKGENSKTNLLKRSHTEIINDLEEENPKKKFKD